MVAADLADGRLVELLPQNWDGRPGMPRLPVMAARPKAGALGVAGTWLFDRLSRVQAEAI